MVCKERHKLAHTQCPCQERWEARGDSYAYLLNSCGQSWFAILSILEQLVTVIKIDHLTITKVHLRSGKAGCHHNSSLLATFRGVGSRQRIDVVRYNFSEPQHGKDICDRIYP